jgi:hypothetical protein
MENYIRRIVRELLRRSLTCAGENMRASTNDQALSHFGQHLATSTLNANCADRQAKALALHKTQTCHKKEPQATDRMREL